MIRCIRQFAVVASVLLVASPALAQFRTHKDYGGYTYRTPTSTYSYRYNSGATYFRTGSIATYSARNGTSVYSYYTPTYRFDSFTNPRHGWYGSGYTNYRPSYSTYYRSYNYGRGTR